MPKPDLFVELTWQAQVPGQSDGERAAYGLPALVPGQVYSWTDGGYLSGGTYTESGSARYAVQLQGRADYGHLSVRAHASGSGEYLIFGCGGCPAPASVLAARALVLTADWFEVTSAVLPTGTPVVVDFATRVLGSLEVAQASETFSAADLWMGRRVFVYRGGEQISYEHRESQWAVGAGRDFEGDHALDIDDRQSWLLMLQVGDRVAFGADLAAHFQGGGVSPEFEFGGSVQSMNSAYVGFAPADDRVRLVFASGHDYALPVPEASTGALAAAGLMLMGLWRRRRRTRPSDEQPSAA